MAWAHQHKVLAALLPAALVVVIVGVFLAVSNSGGQASRTSGTGLHETAVTKGAKWVDGPANTLLTAVTADLGGPRRGAGREAQRGRDRGQQARH